VKGAAAGNRKGLTRDYRLVLPMVVRP